MSCAVYKYQILSQVSDWKRSLLEIHGHGLSGIKNDFSILTNSVWTVLRPVGSQSFLRGEKYRGLLISVVSCNSTCWLLSVNPRWCCVGVPTKIIKQRPWGVVCSQAKRAGGGGGKQQTAMQKPKCSPSLFPTPLLAVRTIFSSTGIAAAIVQLWSGITGFSRQMDIL